MLDGKKTIIGIVLTTIQSFPDITDPIWGYVERMGVEDPWLAGMQVATVVATASLAIYGRVKAKGPL